MFFFLFFRIPLNGAIVSLVAYLCFLLIEPYIVEYKDAIQS